MAGQEAEQRGEYDERYPPEQPYSPLSPGANPPGAGYPQPQDNYYPSSNAFPPPPNPAYSPNPAYNPAEYQAQPVQPGQPNAQIHPDYGYPQQQAGNPYAPPGPGGVFTPPPTDPYAAPSAPRRADENVSAEPFLNTSSHVPNHDRYVPNNRYIPKNYRDVTEEGG